MSEIEEEVVGGETAPTVGRDDSVAYVYVSAQAADGWFWQSRDSDHNPLETKGGFKKEAAAAQAGADNHPAQGDHRVPIRTGHDPAQGEE